MGKIALLVPRDEMLYLAHNILQEKKYDIGEMRVIQTEHTVTEARNAIAAGATIIIARGLQASLIKQYTDVPVVEIAATAQEMALLVMKAKQIVKKEKPFIAAVGFKNMFCDMTYFDTIYDIKLRTYFASVGADLKEQAVKAIEEGADLIIGGDVAVSAAKEYSVPSLFLSITEDSLRTAFSMAEGMAFAMGAEKRSHAQIEALLDYSFNGVVNLDRCGKITTVNPVMREILKQTDDKIHGRKIEEIFSDIDKEKLRQILEGREESYASFMEVNGTSVFAVLAPVKVGNEAEGAILTCHRVKRQKTAVSDASDGYKKEGRYRGMTARGSFGQILQLSRAMQECVRLARFYAQSELPVLISGETGCECRLLAESIHSMGNDGPAPFLAWSGAGQSAGRQRECLFGEKGIVYMVNGGSLLIENAESLALENQYELYQLIRYRQAGPDVMPAKPLHVRIFASTSLTPVQLLERVKAGSFREDLYCLLSGLLLTVPPLRKRREDLAELIVRTVKDACERYSRYHVLTKGALSCLEAYSWPGNLLQLETFLRRLILTAERRSIDEVMIKKLLRELYPQTSINEEISECIPEHLADVWSAKEDELCCLGGFAGTVAFSASGKSEEEVRIRAALTANGGSREKTAVFLGISKATLWRKMKKYEINE